jgi:hypothetical protein
MFKIFKYKLSERENKIKELIEIFICNKNTNILTCPITGRYFLENKKLSYYFVIHQNSIKITNHKHHYNYDICGRFSSIITNIIVDRIKYQRDILEQEIFNNENTLLNQIKETILKTN